MNSSPPENHQFHSFIFSHFTTAWSRIPLWEKPTPRSLCTTSMARSRSTLGTLKSAPNSITPSLSLYTLAKLFSSLRQFLLFQETAPLNFKPRETSSTPEPIRKESLEMSGLSSDQSYSTQEWRSRLSESWSLSLLDLTRHSKSELWGRQLTIWETNAKLERSGWSESEDSTSQASTRRMLASMRGTSSSTPLLSCLRQDRPSLMSMAKSGRLETNGLWLATCQPLTSLMSMKFTKTQSREPSFATMSSATCSTQWTRRAKTNLAKRFSRPALSRSLFSLARLSSMESKRCIFWEMMRLCSWELKRLTPRPMARLETPWIDGWSLDLVGMYPQLRSTSFSPGRAFH